MADPRVYAIPRLQALALGEARGEALARVLAPLGVHAAPLPMQGIRLAGVVWDHALRVASAQTVSYATIIDLEGLLHPDLLLASIGVQKAHLQALRCAVRPVGELEILCQAALAWGELDAGRPIYVGELAALAGVSSASIFKSHKARREPPFRLDAPQGAQVTAEHARAYLRTRIREIEGGPVRLLDGAP